MQSHGEIHARKLHVGLAEEDLVDGGSGDLGERIEQFTVHRGIDNVLVTTDGNVLLDSAKRIKFNSGTKTIQMALQLNLEPTRLKTFNPLPGAFLSHYFRDGFDETKVLYRCGQRFETQAIEADIRGSFENARTTARNILLLERSTRDLLADGTIKVENARSVEDSKKFVAELQREAIVREDLVFNERYQMPFRYWDQDAETLDCTVSDGEPYVVFILSRQGRVDAKRKHYWIYSHMGNYGKTYAIKEFATKYNAHYVSDPNNWMGVPRTAQFLMFDEFGKDKKLSVDSLKSLTAGTAECAGCNRKSYGASYVPLADVQIVITSNKSPYEIYGEYDPKAGRRFIDKDVLQQLGERFFVHRVDGPLDEDRQRYTEPSLWTGEQFDKELCSIFAASGQHGVTVSTKGVIGGVFKLVRKAKLLWDARYLVLDASMTVIEALAHKLDELPIAIPGLHVSLGKIARELYDCKDVEKTCHYFNCGLDRLIDQENEYIATQQSVGPPLDTACHEDPPRMLENFLNAKQFWPEKYGAYTDYIRQNRRQLYDDVFAATIVQRDQVADMYTPEILAEMLAKFDDTYPPSAFASDTIRRFLMLVLQEYFSEDQSRVAIEQQRTMENIAAHGVKRKRADVGNVYQSPYM